MLLNEPPRTNYDLHFRIANIPIRVHPLFWLIALVLGLQPGTQPDGGRLIIWIGVLFFSITIHELGHSFAYRRYGMSSRIVLHHFGGVAIADSFSDSVGWGRRLTPWGRVFISFAGPLAQFILVAITLLILAATNTSCAFLPLPGFIVNLLPDGELITNNYLAFLVQQLIWVNFWWAVFNLLPIYPLDGGQISRELFVTYSRANGIRNSLILAIVAAAAMVAYCIHLQARYMIFLFIILGIENYMNLKRLHGGGFGGFGGGGSGGGGYGGGGYGGGGRPW